MQERTCLICHAAFSTSRSNQVFCSIPCREAARYQRRGNKRQRHICQVCGTPGCRNDARTCSLACGLILRSFDAGKAPSSEWACLVPWDRIAPRSPWVAPPVCRTCRQCFTPDPEMAWQITCPQCQTDRRKAAKVKQRTEKPAWFRAMRTKDAALRRAAKRHNADLIDPRDVYERDYWTCHLCGLLVLPVKHQHMKAPHPWGPSLDHLTPLSLGGTHTWDNVALAHFICNSKRGNTPLTA